MQAAPADLAQPVTRDPAQHPTASERAHARPSSGYIPTLDGWRAIAILWVIFAHFNYSRRYFAPVEMPANNLANLFEMPVLFFALVPLLLMFRQVTAAQLALAWAFVALRAAHSVVHIARGPVRARFRIYAASVAVLTAMWIGFFVDALAAWRLWAIHAGLTAQL